MPIKQISEIIICDCHAFIFRKIASGGKTLKKKAKLIQQKQESDGSSAVTKEKFGIIRKLFKKKPGKKTRAKKKISGFLSNVKIAPRLLAGFLIIALLSAFMGVYASLSLNTVSAASDDMYGKVLLPTKNSYELSLNIEDQLSTLRQAISNPTESMLPAYASTIKTKLSSCDGSISMVKGLMPPDKMADFDAFMPVYEKYKAQLTSSLDQLAAGNVQAISDDINGYGPLYTAQAEVVKAVAKLRSSISGDAAATATANKKQAATVLTVTIVGISLVVVLSVLIGIFMARGISKPLKSLTRDIKRLAAGETDIDLAAKTTKDEVGQMHEAIRTIVQVLRDLVEDTGMLVDAAAEGRLSARADASRHTGAYRRIVEGTNATLDAMMAPIQESAQVLGELSQGNLGVSVTGDFHGDFSIVKDALNTTIDTLKMYIGEITFALGEIAKGTLTARIDSDFKGDFTAIKESFNQSVTSFSNVLIDIDTAAGEVAAGTAQLSAGSQVISQGAAEQASALEQLTATLTQISSQTAANVQSANAARDLSKSAMKFATNGSDKMNQLQAAMEDIRTSSASISKIIKAIDNIAFQTNILALNAAVEAARAGVHGKGFAVVADEVRKLAARSAEAAQETTVLVEGSINKTGAGAKIANETAAALADIVSSVEKTTTLSAEIATASGEQASGISQIDKGIEQLSQVVQNNSATAQEAAASSEELSAQAEHLKAMVGRFHLSDDAALLHE